LRTNRNLNVKLRLGEINRRFAELSAISSKLEEMALQLDRLRTLNGRIELLGHRNCAQSRKDSVITVCRSNAGSEGKSLMQSDSTTTPHE
jgi:hypothetical protein